MNKPGIVSTPERVQRAERVPFSLNQDSGISDIQVTYFLNSWNYTCFKIFLGKATKLNSNKYCF